MDEDRREREKLTARPENLLELAVSTMIDKRLHGQHTMDLDTTEHQDPLPMLAAALSHGKGSKNVASPGVALGQSSKAAKETGKAKGKGKSKGKSKGKGKGSTVNNPVDSGKGPSLQQAPQTVSAKNRPPNGKGKNRKASKVARPKERNGGDQEKQLVGTLGSNYAQRR